MKTKPRPKLSDAERKRKALALKARAVQAGKDREARK